MIAGTFFRNFASCVLLSAVSQPQLLPRAAPVTLVNRIQNLQKMCSCAVKDVPKVEIDPEGVFKYILLNVHDAEKRGNEESVTIVRGYKRHNYHSDIYDEVQDKLKPLDCEPIGGGRISHDPNDKKIHIYGYSQGYGKADHEVTAKLIKEAFPGYTVTISDEGY